MNDDWTCTLCGQRYVDALYWIRDTTCPKFGNICWDCVHEALHPQARVPRGNSYNFHPSTGLPTS